MTAGVAMLPGSFAFGADAKSKLYPPALTGLRGSHPGAFEVAHSLRDGTFWANAGTPTDTGETYDLVIVGGGISGLSAAHFFRKQAGPNAKILILENHDDFGGHAKRNEFRVGKKFLLGYGGTFSIESPRPYSAVAKGIVAELGIDVSSYSKLVDKNLYRSQGLIPNIFFDKETFGADKLLGNPLLGALTDTGDKPQADDDLWKKFMAEAPLSETAKNDLKRLLTEQKDYYPGLSSTDKKAKLARISYAKFLTEVAGVSPEIVSMFQAIPTPNFGLGIDAISAQDAWGIDLPGFVGMHLDPAPGKGMNYDAILNEEAEKYFFHFPDGNASIARMLVRKLLPEAISGDSANDIVTARADYLKLDQASSPVRIRLNSTVVRVKHNGDVATAKDVEVAYVNNGKLFTTHAAHCILACWHVVIPYICDELPDTQKDALSNAAKVPLLYTNVAIRNWTAFQKLGVSSIYAPGSYYTQWSLDLPVSIGQYHCSRKPDEPIVVHLMRAPNKPGRPGREQHRIGRGELYATSFETLERNTREQMARALSAGGFDPARDIAAITTNRWPHGYAYEYNSLWDKFWLEGGELPCEVARKPFGRLAIANADAGAYAYTDCAIDQAYRAVGEITKV